MQFNYVIPHISTLKYHPFTASTNHVNSKANLTTLPLMQVDFHQEVICFCLYITWTSDECLDYPQTILQKCINLWFYIPKIYFRNTLMCVRSTLCNVLLPVEWKFLGKRFAFFVCSPITPSFLVFKNHTENVKLDSGCISLISLITWKSLRTSKTSIISCLSFHFVSYPARSGNSCFYFSNLGASNQEY